MREIDLMTQTIAAELGQQLLDRESAAWPLSGRVIPATVKGRRYWYLDDGGKRTYLGPDTDSDLQKRIDAFKREKNGFRQRRRLVSLIVRSASLPRVPTAVCEALRALPDGFVVSGDIAYGCYSLALGVRLPPLGRDPVVETTSDPYLTEDPDRSVVLGDGGISVLIPEVGRWAIWSEHHGDPRAEAVLQAMRQVRMGHEIAWQREQFAAFTKS